MDFDVAGFKKSKKKTIADVRKQYKKQLDSALEPHYMQLGEYLVENDIHAKTFSITANLALRDVYRAINTYKANKVDVPVPVEADNTNPWQYEIDHQDTHEYVLWWWIEGDDAHSTIINWPEIPDVILMNDNPELKEMFTSAIAEIRDMEK